MKMKRTLFLLSLPFVLFLPSDAKTVGDMWVSMPDDMIGYLTKNERMELMDLVDMKVKPQVKNELDGSSSVDTLSNNYLKVTLSSASTIEMKMLPSEGDSLLCVVRTFSAPEKESVVSFYDQNWNEKKINYTIPSLTARPDTMSQEKYDDLCRMIEPYMVMSELSPNDNSLCVSLSMPLQNKEDKTSLKPILLQRKLKWNGETFKEY